MGIFDKLLGNNNANKPSVGSSSQNYGMVFSNKVEINGEIVEKLCGKYIAFDVETTGLSPYTDRIVELGAVQFENGAIVNRFSALVNPRMLIPEAASQVNHITNDMLRNAPFEEQIYPSFVDFLGDALNGNTIICAHNAKFDMDFLCQTLRRLGYNGKISYVDTLSLARKNLNLENYKQDTVAASFGIVNQNSHRAVTDAEVCGKILWELLKTVGKDVRNREKTLEKKYEARKLSDEELEICAVLQDAIVARGGNSQWLRYYKNSSGYIDVFNYHTILKFKFVTKGKYVIVPENIVTPFALPVEKCSVNEGGTNNKRVYFSSPYNLGFLGDYLYSMYKNAETSMVEYFRDTYNGKREVEKSIALMTKIEDADIPRLLAKIEGKNYDGVPGEIDTGRNICRDDVIVNATHTRCPLSEIKNYGEYTKGFEAGFPIYEQGEGLRKAGEITAAIILFDKAREVGYDAPALYNSYAKAFRKIKDYANEILIIEEYTQRFPDIHDGELEARRDKAIELLYDLQQEEIKKAEKNATKERKKADKDINIETKESTSSVTTGRAIIQLNDDGNIVREFESVSLASKEVGVSPKSIRDAAKGVQKHAGGFVWKYKDEMISEV